MNIRQAGIQYFDGPNVIRSMVWDEDGWVIRTDHDEYHIDQYEIDRITWA